MSYYGGLGEVLNISHFKVVSEDPKASCSLLAFLDAAKLAKAVQSICKMEERRLRDFLGRILTSTEGERDLGESIPPFIP